MATLTTVPLSSTGNVTGWVVTAALTFLLIGLPLLYLVALTAVSDDRAVERAVRDQVQFDALKERANAYAYGKDVYGVLATPLRLEPLAATATRPSVGSRAVVVEPSPPRRHRATERPQERSYTSVGSLV